MIDINAIKSRISCVDYARSQGLNVNKSGSRICSPLRAESNNPTSFVVYDDFFFDFGSGQGGDVIDLAAELNFKGDRGQAISELARLTNVDAENSTEWVSYTKSLNAEIEHYHRQLNEDDRKYIHSRGITDETIARLKLGRTDNGRLCIPYWKNGYIAYYITRHLNGGQFPESKYRKMKIDGMNEHCPWGLHTLTRDPEKKLLVIAEGSFDIMSFEQENYCCLSAMTGNFSASQIPQVVSICKSFQRVFIVYDNDYVSHAGDKFTFKMAKLLSEKRIPFVVGKVPAKYKDVSDYYADGGNLADLIENAVDGIEFLGSVIDDQKTFEDFARDICRFMTRPSVEQFFKKIKSTSHLDRDWLDTLMKDCKLAPSDKYIAETVLKRHDLIYNDKISFFEFSGKCWTPKNDVEIGAYIDEALGIYTTGAKITSITKIIKSLCVTTQTMNTSHVMNFINGTLELSPEIHFREHRKTDYCLYCLPYPYDPNAQSETWLSFLDAITASDNRKINTLQEFSGYTLFNDNRFCRCPVLIGSGSNGKSVFLNVLTATFGTENVSSIEMSDLREPFQTIQLMNSMLNISGETKTDVNGCESKFKQIVAGDEISACYKGKDFIKFRPRVKMFLSCNSYMKFNDDSDGFSRRIHFINFTEKFCENPTAPNEHLIDYNIESTLTTSETLSAVFNWVLSGYEQLKAVNYFTEADDHAETQEEFEELSNPIIAWLRDYTFPAHNFLSNSYVYNAYKEWCAEENHHPCSGNVFHRRVKRLLPKYHPDVKSTHTDTEKGYRRD